jgi:selT/selW/selH-like putative selenoprotein
LAAELKKDVGATVELVEGSHGVFDVKADGKLVFSKDATGRFPEPGEVSGLLMKQKQKK